MRKLIVTFSVLWCLAASLSLYAEQSAMSPFYNAFYIGFSSGYGSTTWGELVDNDPSESEAVQQTTPSRVKEGGLIWGPFVGFDFSKYFAVEAHYTHYPRAKIYFRQGNSYRVDEITSDTDAFNAIAKVMAPVFHSPLRFYVDAGIGAVHRRDQLARTRWNLGPTFGAGFNYLFNRHIFGEIGFQYYTGNGKSSYHPVDDFVPFLYDAQLRIAYRFDFPDYRLD